MRIAVIPARGGSKRIPRKNVKTFCGRPMISWSIAAARASGLFDHVIVSTDDNEIADVARGAGADVPFVRPADLSNDFAGTTPVIGHAAQWANSQGWDVEAVCCIYATAPFIRPADIKQGWQALNSADWKFAFSVTDFAAPIFRAFRKTDSGGVEMFFPENFATRSQDLPAALHDAGQFYWGRPAAWLADEQIFAPHSTTVFVPRWRVADIDTPDDWTRAEIMAAAILGRADGVELADNT